VGRAVEVVAGFLKVEEAEMLAELLGSAGIDAWFEGAVASCLGPLIPGAGGGARLLVPTSDAGRAREVIAASGIFRAGAAGPQLAAEPEEEPTGRASFSFYPVVIALAVVGATIARYMAGL
jgi:hypothetical protein